MEGASGSRLTPTADDPSVSVPDVETAVAQIKRLDALHTSGILDGALDPPLRRLTRLGGTALDVAACVISIVDLDQQIPVAAYRRSEDVPIASAAVPISRSYCAYAVATGEPLIANDAREHPWLHDNPAITEFGAIAYAGVPITAADGSVLGTFCVLDTAPRQWEDRDVELLEELARTATVELNLHAANERLASLSRLRERSMANASHDLRAPLSAIGGMAFVIEEYAERLTPAEVANHAGMIREQAGSALRLVDELLTVTHLVAGNMATDERDLGLRDIVDRAVRTRLAADPGLASELIRVHIADDLIVHVDSDHTERIVGNLVANGLVHGAPPIEISAAAAGTWVELRVRDHGAGVAAGAESRIFGEFERDADADAEGHGLGLSIVRGLARAQGGDAWYEAADPGASFVVRLPVGRPVS